MKMTSVVLIILVTLLVKEAQSRSLPIRHQSFRLNCATVEHFLLPAQLRANCDMDDPVLRAGSAKGFAPFCTQRVRCHDTEPSRFNVNICPTSCVEPISGLLMDKRVYEQDSVYTNKEIRISRGQETVKLIFPVTCRCTRRIRRRE